MIREIFPTAHAANWRDQPVITDRKAWAIERLAVAAEFQAVMPKCLTVEYDHWFTNLAHALEDVDNRFNAGFWGMK